MKLFLVLSTVLSEILAVSNKVRNVRENLQGHKIIKVEHVSEAHEFLHHLGADQLSYDALSHAVSYKVDENQFASVVQKEHDFKDITEEFIADFELKFNNEHPEFNFCTEGKECARRAAQDYYTEYHPLESIWARMEDLVENSTVASLGSLGLSYEGREQKTVEIVTDPSNLKPLVLYFCNIHAREWITPLGCLSMAETLLFGGEGGEVHYLTEIYDFTILVSANPDGYLYSWSDDNLWRKTRMPNNGSDCVGTDPNRNWGINHGGPGSSPDPCSNTYHGAEALDQPETANIAAYMLENKERLISYNDVHAFYRMWMCPYSGYFQVPPQDDFDKMMTCSEAAVDAIEEVDGERWRFGSASGTVFIASGGSLDWAYLEAGVLYSFAAEVRGDSFQPNSTNIIPSNAELFAGMEASLRCIAATELGVVFPEDEVTEPTPPPTSFPTTGCKDMELSSLFFPDGIPASCEEVAHTCEEDEVIRYRCPKTCDYCPDESNVTLPEIDDDEPYVVPREKKNNDTLPISLGILGVLFILFVAFGLRNRGS
eukprot:augustus_masked-scaffold_13-processed-gene-1.11-mRNA-1 protein AED:1.00 eAED:1.00 QI:0/-1/0/0/-1/1/1/0/541